MTTTEPRRPATPPFFTSATVADLTARERDVLELVTNGYANAEIARLLHLTMNTVKTYIRLSYRKIGAETRSQAIVWGVRHGLLTGVDGNVESNADTDA